MLRMLGVISMYCVSVECNSRHFFMYNISSALSEYNKTRNRTHRTHLQTRVSQQHNFSVESR